MAKHPRRQPGAQRVTGVFVPTNNLITGAVLDIVAGAIPAFQAMQLKISEALRCG